MLPAKAERVLDDHLDRLIDAIELARDKRSIKTALQEFATDSGFEHFARFQRARIGWASAVELPSEMAGTLCVEQLCDARSGHRSGEAPDVWSMKQNAVVDLLSRRVVGWSMKAEMTAQLVTDALIMAIWRRGKPDGCIIRIRDRNILASSSSA